MELENSYVVEVVLYDKYNVLFIISEEILVFLLVG